MAADLIFHRGWLGSHYAANIEEAVHLESRHALHHQNIATEPIA
jgi:hypothetical protein